MTLRPLLKRRTLLGLIFGGIAALPLCALLGLLALAGFAGCVTGGGCNGRDTAYSIMLSVAGIFGVCGILAILAGLLLWSQARKRAQP
jgi:hypothetical protein